MSKDLVARYIWIVDTITRHGTITLRQLNDKWKQTPWASGTPLTRRTFYNYRQAIADAFQVQIGCRRDTYEYFIESGGQANDSVTQWLFNTAAMSEAVAGAGDLSGRIFVEDVPSARTHLTTVISAIRDMNPIWFDYHPFTRVLPTKGVKLRPYFLKLFRQRWYVTGLNILDNRIKTYALDRMQEVRQAVDTRFSMPDDFDAEEYFRYAFGIVFDEGEPKTVQIKTDTRLAKYLRALPLHHTQQESLHDTYSVFTYRLKLTPDLVEELMSHGPSVTVLNPPELRAMMLQRLKDTLEGYRQIGAYDTNVDY